jgi:hypothetical protein
MMPLHLVVATSCIRVKRLKHQRPRSAAAERALRGRRNADVGLWPTRALNKRMSDPVYRLG